MLQKISLAINLILLITVSWLVIEHFNSNGTSAEEDPSTERVENGTSADSLDRQAKEINSNIAFFNLDSVAANYTYMKDKEGALLSEELRLKRSVERQQKEAQKRYEELMNKDQTYSTQAQMEQDQLELQDLMMKVQSMEENARNDLLKMQGEVLFEAQENLRTYLEDYNAEHNFDFIMSIEREGQVWPGNPDLDITQDIIVGLNDRYTEKKAEIEAKKAASQNK